MRRYQVDVAGQSHVVDVQEIGANQFQVSVGGQEFDVTLSAAEEVVEGAVSPEIVPANGHGNGHGGGNGHAPSAGQFKPAPPETLKPMVKAAMPPLPAQPERGAAAGAVKAPMPGTITGVDVQPGQSVAAGQVLVRLEAMKMVNAIKAPRAGVVSEVLVQAGQSVGYGQVLVTFKEA
jgi:biotin carboxyl carrier protein